MRQEAETKAAMYNRGREHAQAGGMLTPFECREIDGELFAAAKGQERPARWYATMRGAFNAGWEAGYFEAVA